MKYRFDVLGLGAVAVDDLLFLNEFPRPDTKSRVVRSKRHAGGLTGTALVAAARMGSLAAYAGTLGDDECSLFVLDSLTAVGIEGSWYVSSKDPHSARHQPAFRVPVVDTTGCGGSGLEGNACRRAERHPFATRGGVVSRIECGMSLLIGIRMLKGMAPEGKSSPGCHAAK